MNTQCIPAFISIGMVRITMTAFFDIFVCHFQSAGCSNCQIDCYVKEYKKVYFKHENSSSTYISTLQHISIVCDFVPNDKWSEVCACECVGEAKTDEFLPPAKEVAGR